MSAADITKLEVRLRSALTVLAPERPLDLPDELRAHFEVVVAATNDALDESARALKEALAEERAA